MQSYPAQSAEWRAKSVSPLHNLHVLFPMSSSQFCKLPISETLKLELLNGEVVVMPRDTPMHQFSRFELAIVISQWARKHDLGRVVPDTLVTLDKKWTPTPDVIFLAKRHLRRVTDRRIEGPVDLAIEVFSRGTIAADRSIKFAAYAKYGVPWYWIVDLKARELEEYGLVQGMYTNLVKAPFDEPFRPRLFPGLVIDLASLEW